MIWLQTGPEWSHKYVYIVRCFVTIGILTSNWFEVVLYLAASCAGVTSLTSNLESLNYLNHAIMKSIHTLFTHCGHCVDALLILCWRAFLGVITLTDNILPIQRANPSILVNTGAITFNYTWSYTNTHWYSEDSYGRCRDIDSSSVSNGSGLAPCDQCFAQIIVSDRFETHPITRPGWFWPVVTRTRHESEGV